MGIEEHKALIRQWVQSGWNQGKVDLVDELYTEDYRPNWVPPEFSMNGAGLKQFVTAYRAGMPDLHLEIADMVAEGDKVAWRFIATGTHTGTLFGVPPTGKSAQIEGIVIAFFRDGKYAEDWATFDQFSLLVQLGIIPVPQPA